MKAISHNDKYKYTMFYKYPYIQMFPHTLVSHHSVKMTLHIVDTLSPTLPPLSGTPFLPPSFHTLTSTLYSQNSFLFTLVSFSSTLRTLIPDFPQTLLSQVACSLPLPLVGRMGRLRDVSLVCPEGKSKHVSLLAT